MKKKFLGLCLLACLVMGAIGCPSKDNPASPSNDTPTFSPTRTSTSTATATVTGTLPTFTATFTATDSPTYTTTSTATETATETFTMTPTATVCTAASIQTTYTFESSPDCWHVDAGNAIIVDSGLSTVQKHGGSSSYSVTINNGTGSAANAQIDLTYATPQDLSGASVTIWYYMDASLAGANMQIAEQNTGCSWDALWINTPATDAWTSVVFSPSTSPCSNASTPDNVNQLVIQLTNVPAGAHGRLYVDDITIVLPAGPTATPTYTLTPNPNYTWNFENNALHNTADATDSWAQATDTGFISGVPFVTAPTVSNGSSYCMAVPVTFTAQNQLAGAILSFATPIDVSALTGIRAKMYLDSAAIPSDCYAGGVIQVGDGANYPESSWQNLTAGAWVQLDYPMSSWGAFTKTNLTMIKCIANTGGSGTFTSFSGTGNVEIDDVELY